MKVTTQKQLRALPAFADLDRDEAAAMLSYFRLLSTLDELHKGEGTVNTPLVAAQLTTTMVLREIHEAMPMAGRGL